MGDPVAHLVGPESILPVQLRGDQAAPGQTAVQVFHDLIPIPPLQSENAEFRL